MELNHIQNGMIGAVNLDNIYHEGRHNRQIHLYGIERIRVVFQKTKGNAQPSEQIPVVQNRTMRAANLAVSVGKRQTIEILTYVVDNNLRVRVGGFTFADKTNRDWRGHDALPKCP